MSIVFKSGIESKLLSAQFYESEKMLEKLLADYPELLGLDETQRFAFVYSQLHLDSKRILDLFFVSSGGLPIIVEVKLAVNPESKKEVVAQAIDYLSALSQLDVDQVDTKTGGLLEKALRGLADDDSEFETLWAAVAGNLRTGKTRIVIAVDQAPLELVRIFRFLAEYSDLDIQLLTIQRFTDQEGREVFVPQLVVDPASESKPKKGASPIYKTIEECLEVCQNQAARDFFEKRLEMPRNSHGSALAYREAGPIHWYVEPTRDGAKVTQIDRFDGDEEIWRTKLSNPEIGQHKSKGKDNLRFNLTTSDDFRLFEDIVEREPKPSRQWKKP